MVFVADDFAAWLVETLADAGRKKLAALILGTDQQRALRKAATAAVQRTAAELRPGDEADLAMVVSEVFAEPVPAAPLDGHQTLLEALGAGIAAQLAVLDDASLTGTGQSSADVLGVPGSVVAGTLTGHLLREIVTRGAGGGPLFPLASQLNDDVTHLQGQRLEDMLGQVADQVRDALARPDAAHAMAAAPTAMAQLPSLTVGFTGRDGELAVLADLLNPAGGAGPVLVSAVAGMAGVGKTTLAVAAGHAAVQRGWFTGGVLFVNLHGYDDHQVESGQALDVLLRALAVPVERIPPGTEERAGLYRSALAHIGEPVLVIADNASTEAQVRPLLPGGGPHRVLVTSRHILAGLGARLVGVKVLDEPTAMALLDSALRAGRPDDDRISSDPASAARLAEVCGGLPLALQITAALLTADPALSASELADELAAESHRLERLAYDDGSGTGASVAAAFELSYRKLDDTTMRVFRLLPVNPGPDVSTAAAAALAGMPVSETRTVLGGLARAHLAEAVPNAGGRWRMLDLLRLYAGRLSDEHAEADGREQARDRLLDHYLHAADAADVRLRALPGTDVPGQFTDRAQALAWLDAERASLVAAVMMAAATGRDQAAMRLPLTLAEYFSWRRRLDDWVATSTISRDAARRLGDRRREGDALTSLGRALMEVRLFDEAIIALQDAAAIFRDIGDRHSEAIAVIELGAALRFARRFDEAIVACQAAVAMFCETGDRNREGNAVGTLGFVLQGARRFDEAVTACKAALAIHQETGDRNLVGADLTNIGYGLYGARRFDEAITACQEAVAIHGETGDRNREADALTNLGFGLLGARRFDEAITVCQESAAIARDTGDWLREADALTNLGNALAEVGRAEEAITACQDATTKYRDIGNRHREAWAQTTLGLALTAAGRTEEAITACQDAVAIYRETGDRYGEAEALTGLGPAMQEAGRFDEAINACQDAAAIFRDAGDEHSERIALENLDAAKAAQQAAG